jgi:hypothetical protein
MHRARRDAELLFAEGFKLLARSSDLDCDPDIRSRRVRDGYLRLAEGHTRLAEIHDDELVEVCACAAHEVNRAYCLAIGDDSQPSWDSAPDWQKVSAKKGVAGALAGNTPEQSHESWLVEKVSTTGWKYGPVKDPAKKEHPCIVPYADLPAAQRVKDALFVNTVRTVAKVLGR